jgi:hypothetical protein
MSIKHWVGSIQVSLFFGLNPTTEIDPALAASKV